jgi:enterobacteria phage integrase
VRSVRSSKSGYSSRLELIRTDHGRSAFSGLTKERIETFILAPLANKPGAALDTLKKLRILINHFGITPDPTARIKRSKSKEIRSWTDRELATYERRWPIDTKQRTAYALMLNMGTARVDTHLLTWHQVDDGACYRRHKTAVQIDMDVTVDLVGRFISFDSLCSAPFQISGKTQRRFGWFDDTGLNFGKL